MSAALLFKICNVQCFLYSSKLSSTFDLTELRYTTTTLNLIGRYLLDESMQRHSYLWLTQIKNENFLIPIYLITVVGCERLKNEKKTSVNFLLGKTKSINRNIIYCKLKLKMSKYTMYKPYELINLKLLAIINTFVWIHRESFFFFF